MDDVQRVALVGQPDRPKLRHLERIVRERGGALVESPEDAELIVIAGGELPLWSDQLSDQVRAKVEAGTIRVLGEDEFLAAAGQGKDEPSVRRLYTPAMLAELLNVPVSTIRRWRRRGLIVAVHEVGRLPYFDFQEVATARRLAHLIASGTSAAVIERKLANLARVYPLAQRPLDQLQIMVEGKHVLLRQGEGLIDAGGQLWLDFDAADQPARGELSEARKIVPFPRAPGTDSPAPTAAELAQLAFELEEEGQLTAAADAYRAALAAGGPSPELCFQLADVLYRLGDVTAARERFFTAIELDENYVEARANLGCVLAEQGQLDLAIAAFEGALAFHADYPDAHYHLARLLESRGAAAEAQAHWIKFLELSPDSPWADEARLHLPG